MVDCRWVLLAANQLPAQSPGGNTTALSLQHRTWRLGYHKGKGGMGWGEGDGRWENGEEGWEGWNGDDTPSGGGRQGLRRETTSIHLGWYESSIKGGRWVPNPQDSSESFEEVERSQLTERRNAQLYLNSLTVKRELELHEKLNYLSTWMLWEILSVAVCWNNTMICIIALICNLTWINQLEHQHLTMNTLCFISPNTDVKPLCVPSVGLSVALPPSGAEWKCMHIRTHTRAHKYK